MADNIAVTPGSGKNIAADEVDGVLHQRVKLSVGDDGAAADLSSGAGSVDAGVPRVTLADDDPAVAKLNTINTAAQALAKPVHGGYETVAASQTAQVLGNTGAAGDWLERLIITPANTSPGAVAVLDGGTSITLFAGGATSVADLAPIVVPFGMASASGPWKITTGADVSVIAVGKFT